MPKYRSKLKGAEYVDMGEYAHSASPMYSTAYANCLGIVVHDGKRKAGSLAHVFPGSAGSAKPEFFVQLYVNTIEKMIAFG